MKTFYPRKSISIVASEPHPHNTEYKISIGTEIWNDRPTEVVKVQMVYNGKVEGRKSPSYPVGTNDHEEVNRVIEELLLDNEN